MALTRAPGTCLEKCLGARADPLRQGAGEGQPPHYAPAKNTRTSAYDVRTSVESHSERIDLRATPSQVAALDYLAGEWNATRSQVIRGMIVGAALAQLDRLDEALDASEPSFDALVDVPSIDDVLAGL